MEHGQGRPLITPVAVAATLDLLHTQGLGASELDALIVALDGYESAELIDMWCPNPGLKPLQFDPPCRGMWIATDINRWVYKIQTMSERRWHAALSTENGDMALTDRNSLEAAILGCEAHRRQLRMVGTGTVARHLLRSGCSGS